MSAALRVPSSGVPGLRPRAGARSAPRGHFGQGRAGLPRAPRRDPRPPCAGMRGAGPARPRACPWPARPGRGRAPAQGRPDDHR